MWAQVGVNDSRRRASLQGHRPSSQHAGMVVSSVSKAAVRRPWEGVCNQLDSACKAYHRLEAQICQRSGILAWPVTFAQ